MLNFPLQNILNGIKPINLDERINIKFVMQISSSTSLLIVPKLLFEELKNYGFYAEILVLL